MKAALAFALLLPIAAYAAESAKVEVPDDKTVAVTVAPTTRSTASAAAPTVIVQPSPWAPVRDAIIYALVGIIAAGGPVVVIWIRSLGVRLSAAEANAT